jgi:hypothetical protein
MPKKTKKKLFNKRKPKWCWGIEKEFNLNVCRRCRYCDSCVNEQWRRVKEAPATQNIWRHITL